MITPPTFFFWFFWKNIDLIFWQWKIDKSICQYHAKSNEIPPKYSTPKRKLKKKLISNLVEIFGSNFNVFYAWLLAKKDTHFDFLIFVFSNENASNIFAHLKIDKSMVWNYVERHESFWKWLTAERKLQQRWSWTIVDILKSAPNLVYPLGQFFDNTTNFFFDFFEKISILYFCAMKNW